MWKNEGKGRCNLELKNEYDQAGATDLDTNPKVVSVCFFLKQEYLIRLRIRKTLFRQIYRYIEE